MELKGEKNKMKTWKKVLIIILSILIALSLAVTGVCVYMFKDLTIQKIDKEELGISPSVTEEKKDSKIKNIALFGVDGINESDYGRSDSIIIVSINLKDNKVKMSSILRDSYVSVEGYGKEKINHAYSYGGAPLAIKTLNQNFNLDITDYVSAKFDQFEKVIDLIGGVDVQISSAESAYIPDVKTGVEGIVHLNGKQALAYTRIRYLDSDNVRANRQKIVLEAAMKKIKSVSAIKYASLIKSICSTVETSLGYQELIEMSSKINKLSSNIEQTNVPNEKDNAVGGIYEPYGLWVWRYDLEAASKRLHKFIYDN